MVSKWPASDNPLFLPPILPVLQGFQNGFGSWSYSASFSDKAKTGVNGDQATCGTMQPNGAFQAGRTSAGGAAGKSAFQFWVDAPQDLTVTVGSPSVSVAAGDGPWLCMPGALHVLQARLLSCALSCALLAQRLEWSVMQHFVLALQPCRIVSGFAPR
jgi:hypothetical protein